MDQEAHFHKKHANIKCQRVKVNDSCVPALEDETDVQHLLAEPKADNVSVDGALCFGKENLWKHPELEDFSYGFEYGLQGNGGGLPSGNNQGQDELGLGVLDGLLDDVDEVDDIHAANDISGACEDFLLDIELAEKISDLDYTPFGGLQLGNSSSESQSPGSSGSSNGALGLSESSTATPLEPDYKKGSLEKTAISESPDSAEDKRQCQAPVVDIPANDPENLDELDNDEKPIVSDNDEKPSVSDTSFDENEKKADQGEDIGTFFKEKRLRRPTKRFIEEFSGRNSKNVMGRQKVACIAPKDKCPKIMLDDELHDPITLMRAPKEETLSEIISQATTKDIEEPLDQKSKRIIARLKISSSALKDKHLKISSRNEHHCARVLKSALKEDSSSRTGSRAALESWPRRGHPKRHASVSVHESGDEQSTSGSEDEHVKIRKKCKKGGDRRKHQRMWTLSEVSKLIEGISKYGTGRWTDIKNLLFPSSAYRTPIDLRDKWRNLLRASCSQKHKQKKEVEHLKQSMRPLPNTVIRRIRELAILHPYPRFMPGGRYIRNKKN